MIPAGVAVEENIKPAIRHLMKKIELFRSEGHRVPPHKIIKNKDQIAGMKASAAINIAVLDYVGEHIHAGMSTEEIDKMVYERTTAMGGIPAPLHYQGFPKSVCTSINEQVCHGIPSEEDILKRGRHCQCGLLYDPERIFFRLFENVLYRRSFRGEKNVWWMSQRNVYKKV